MRAGGDKRFRGWSNCRLCSDPLVATLLAARLGEARPQIGRLISSDLPRAAQTAEPIARAVGVNVSPEQVEHCQRQGLQVFCANYRDLLESSGWHGQFDGVIANGWRESLDLLRDYLEGVAHD